MIETMRILGVIVLAVVALVLLGTVLGYAPIAVPLLIFGWVATIALMSAAVLGQRGGRRG